MFNAKCRGFLSTVSRTVDRVSNEVDSSGRTISWLIFNAGVAEVIGFDWLLVLKQTLDPLMLFTLPRYMIERVGSMTADGIGLIFQANVFGHYYIVPSTQPTHT